MLMFVAIMVVVTCIVVVMRYGLDMGSVMLQDVVLYLHGGLFYLVLLSPLSEVLTLESIFFIGISVIQKSFSRFSRQPYFSSTSLLGHPPLLMGLC